MTKKEIEIQKALGTYLPMKWKECQKLLKEGEKFWIPGDKLRNEGYEIYLDAVKEVYGDKKVWIDWTTGKVRTMRATKDKISKAWEECNKLRKEGNNLLKEGNKLRDAGYKLYQDAVKEVYSNKVYDNKRVVIDWRTGKVEIL